MRQEEISREDLEGAKPDWNGEFIQWDSRWREEQLEIGGPRDLPLTIYLSAKEQEFLDRVVAKIRPHFSSKEDLVTHLLGSTIAEGMSGFSFMRLVSIAWCAGLKSQRPGKERPHHEPSC